MIGGLGLIIRTFISQIDDLSSRVTSGIDEVQRWLAQGPLHISDAQLSQYIERAQQAITQNQGTLTSGAIHAWPSFAPDGRLFIYGPFKRGGQHTSESNAAFDRSLRDGNPEWGVRDVEDLGRVADGVGLKLADVIAMPANNLVLAFARGA